MKVRTVLALVVGIVAACSQPGAAQKQRSSAVPDLPYWTLKGQPARQLVPGLNAALLLTAEQSQRLQAAWEETVGSEAVVAAGRTVKTDANATAAERQAALETIATAKNQLRQSIDMVLTPDQKALIEKVNALFLEVQQGMAEQFQGELAAVKGQDEEGVRLRNEMRARAEAELTRRLGSMLSPDQREAMQRAAAEEKRAAEEGARAKTGK